MGVYWKENEKIYNTIRIIWFFLAIFRNVFIDMGILDASYGKYSFGNIIIAILNTFLFQSVEPFSAAMWFIPVLLVSLIAYNFITSIVQNSTNKKELKRTLIVLMLTVLGIYLNDRNYNIGLHYQTVFVVIPFIHIGQIIKLYFSDKIKPNIIVSIITIIFSIICLKYLEGGVELSMNQIWNPFIFYGLGTMLIFATYTICYYIDKILPKITLVLEYIGKNTFQIMCLHIVGFKLFDFVIIKLFTKEYILLPKFTFSYSQLFPWYVIIGIIFPLISVHLLKMAKEYINEKKHK